MFKPRWLHDGERESKICQTQEEYDSLWAAGWRGSPAELPDAKLAYLEFLDEIAVLPEAEDVTPKDPPQPPRRGPGRPPKRY